MSAFLIQGTGAMLILLSEVVLARLLGVKQFGYYATVIAWMFALVLVGTLGLNHVLLRYVPAYLAREEWGNLRGLLRRTSRWSLVATLTLAVLVALALLTLRGSLAMALIAAFVVALPSLPLQVLAGLRQTVLRGLQQIVLALSPEFILRPALLLLFMGGAALGAVDLNAATALAFNLMAIAVAFVVGNVWLHRQLPSAVQEHAALYHDREWFVVALPLFAIVGLGLIESSRIDIVLLGMLAGTDQAGIYAAANRLAEVILFAVAAANAAVAPLIARLHATGEHLELQRVVKFAVGSVLLFAIPIALALVFFGPWFLALFGPQFEAGYVPLLLLVVTQLLGAIFGPVLFLLTMTGYQYDAASIMGLAVAAKLLLALLLIPGFGMTGAACATLFCALLWNLLMLRAVRRRLGIEGSVLVFIRRPQVENGAP